MINKFITRIRNTKVITGIVSGILLILVNSGAIDSNMSTNVTNGLNVVLSVGVTMGIFGNPETPLIK